MNDYDKLIVLGQRIQRENVRVFNLNIIVGEDSYLAYNEEKQEIYYIEKDDFIQHIYDINNINDLKYEYYTHNFDHLLEGIFD